jgi:phage-related protein
MPSPTEERSTHPQLEQIRADLRKAQQEGQLRTDRVREIVKTATAQAVGEIKQGSSEIRSIAKEALAIVVESLQGRGKEIRDELSASIEGIVEGVSHSRREAITRSETEINQLQAQVREQEEQLNAEIEHTLAEIDTTAKSSSSELRDAIESTVATLRDSEEMALLRKRYAQLQAQLSILKANLAARYGDRYEEMKHHLEDAKVWYGNTRDQADQAGSSAVEQKQVEFERKIGEAGTAIARKEKQVKQILKELLNSIVEVVREDKDPR